MLDPCKMLQKQSEAFHTFLWHFSKFKIEFIAYRFSKVSDCIFEIHQLWQSSFSRVYSNCCCSCSFEPEIIKIGWSSHNMYSNNILNFLVTTSIVPDIGLAVRVFAKWPGRPGFNPRSSHTKDSKNGTWCLLA